jgi:tetratricopeptide (TPR) repeat protein
VTAARIDERARRVAARFPNDPVAQSTLAEAELNAHNYQEAIAAADRALTADSKDVKAMIVKGKALMGEAKSSPAGARWDDIRALFIAANHLDSENPEPLLLYYRTYKESGASPTPSAVSGLLYALVLAPQDGELRLIAVRQLIVDGRTDEAKKEFAPLAADPHARDFHDIAKDIRAALDASDRTRALSLIDGWQAKQEAKDS